MLMATVNRQDATPLEMRTAASSAYKLEDYSLARQLLERVLAGGFEVPGTNCHLARIYLLTDNFSEASLCADAAWQHRTEAPPYVLPRILWLKAALMLLDHNRPAISAVLGQIKTALQAPNSLMEWEMSSVMAILKPKLAEDDHTLLAALVAALSLPDRRADLEAFSAWREAAPLQLECSHSSTSP
jgi:hypothetical protein